MHTHMDTSMCSLSSLRRSVCVCGRMYIFTYNMDRLNLSAVLQTDLVYEVSRHVTRSQCPQQPSKALYRRCLHSYDTYD